MELKISNKLFLGKEELNHLKSSLSDNGFRRIFKQVIENYGVVRLQSDTSFSALKVVAGTTNGQLTISAGNAIDKNIDVIEVKSALTDHLTCNPDSVTRYVKAKYKSSTEMEGTVSVTATGAVTGVGTNFTKYLRGIPNFPSVIKFSTPSANTQEYQVASVTNDTTMQLNVGAGIITAETAKKISVVGTFTPTVSIPLADKYPFAMDGYEITLESTNTVVAGEEFILASVVNDGATTTITDLRMAGALFSLTGSSLGADITTSSAVVGHDSVRNMHTNSPKDKALLTTTWSLNASTGNWSYNVPSQLITVTAASGGSIANIAATTSGQFNGWYAYSVADGKRTKIISSTTAGSTLTLSVEYIGSLNVSDDLRIVPNADFIEFWTNKPVAGVLTNRTYIFDINDGSGNMEVITGHNYKFKWRHIKANAITPWIDVNAGSYQPEANHDANGAYTSGSATAYTVASGITISDNPKNHQIDKASRTEPNTFTSASTNVFDGMVTVNRGFIFGTYYPTASLAPISHNNGTVFQGYSAFTARANAGNVTFTGFTDGSNGRLVMFQVSTDTTGVVTVTNEDTLSLPQNRVRTRLGVNTELRAGDAIWLRYDSQNLRWVEVAASIASEWIDHTTNMTVVGSDVSTTTNGFNRTRYKWIDKNTLQMIVYRELNCGDANQRVSLATMPFPTLPTGKTVLQANTMGMVTADAATSFIAGRTQRPCVVNVSASGIEFYATLDSGEFIRLPAPQNRIVFAGTFTIALY